MSEILAGLLFGATLAALLAGFPVAFTLAGSALIFAVLGHFAGVFELSLLGTFAPQIFGRMTNGLLARCGQDVSEIKEFSWCGNLQEN